MITYDEFTAHKIDLSPLGLQPPSKDFTPYFCTPKNSVPIGSLGVDGIHFVFVRGHGETVFVITPMGDHPYFFPIARNFEHFLRLIIAVKDCGTMEYMRSFSEEDLLKYQAENPPTEEAEKTILSLTSLGLDSLPSPCTYVSDLNGSFDFSSVRFSGEYYDITGGSEPPEIKFEVYFENNEKYPCSEINLNKNFLWRNTKWHVPAVHISKKGAVIDICTAIERSDIKYHKNGDSPLDLHFSAQLSINGKPIAPSSVNYYYASLYEYNENFPSDGWGNVIAEHYDLDADKYWIISRSFFKNAGKCNLTSAFGSSADSSGSVSVSLVMNDEPCHLNGDPFTVNEIGEIIRLRSPVDGKNCYLKVENVESDIIPSALPIKTASKFPSHVKILSFSCSFPNSDLKSSNSEKAPFYLHDILNGDPVVTAENDDLESSVIGIIGGADGPTAILFSSPEPHTPPSDKKFHAVSNPHYSEDFTPLWQPVWRTPTFPSDTFILK